MSEAATSTAATLTVTDMTVTFGGITALNRASLTAEPARITGLIGPNGAGKTTMFNCLTGIYACDTGSVDLDGVELVGRMPHEIATLGVSRTFQNLALFPGLSVRDNVSVGLHRTRSTGWLPNALRLPNVRAEERKVRAAADEALADVGLGAYAEQPAAGLPYGYLKRIELARAIAARPRLLLLDEPAAGLNHSEVDELAELLRDMRDRHQLSIVLVEHHMGLVMQLCDVVTVLNFGETIATGDPKEISKNPQVIEAYLGVSDDELA